MDEPRLRLKTSIEDINNQRVPFASSKLAAFNSTDFELISHRKGTVDLSKVVGCEHPDYAGLTWGVLKPSKKDIFDDEDPEFENQSLSRARRNMLDLYENPEYYLSFEEKRNWSFAEVDGRLYITEGVHRSVIGRYFFHLNGLPPIVHGVSIAKMKPIADDINTVEQSGEKQIIKFNAVFILAILLIVAVVIWQ